MVGPLAEGAPSTEKCKHRRSRIDFKVAYFPRPFEPPSFNPSSVRRGGASPSVQSLYDEQRGCIHTREPGTVIPASVGSWELHLMPGVRRSTGEELKTALVSHRVAEILHAGLGSQPRNSPEPIPIFLIPGSVITGSWKGASQRTCENNSVDAIIVATGSSHPRRIAARTAHELFHAYSSGLRGDTTSSWVEEAFATWSESKTGFGADEHRERYFDHYLQHPMPIDSVRPPYYPYAMWRFVQFLDDRGLV
jgi:hypothetical protein